MFLHFRKKYTCTIFSLNPSWCDSAAYSYLMASTLLTICLWKRSYFVTLLQYAFIVFIFPLYEGYFIFCTLSLIINFYSLKRMLPVRWSIGWLIHFTLDLLDSFVMQISKKFVTNPYLIEPTVLKLSYI